MGRYGRARSIDKLDATAGSEGNKRPRVSSAEAVSVLEGCARGSGKKIGSAGFETARLHQTPFERRIQPQSCQEHLRSIVYMTHNSGRAPTTEIDVPVSRAAAPSLAFLHSAGDSSTRHQTIASAAAPESAG